MERLIVPSTIKLGVFDIDGTIREGNGIPEGVQRGFTRLHEHEILTTVMTGRGYNRFLLAMDTHKDHMVSPSLPIGLENGGRITDSQGNTLRRFPLALSEIEGTLSHISDYSPDFFLYYPADTRKKPIMWCPGEVPDDLALQFSESVDFTTEPILQLRKRLIQEWPSMLVIKPKNEEDFPSGLNATTNGNAILINAEGVSKGMGVTEIADLTNTPLSNFLVAGNDNNDREMLDLPIGLKIFVGDNMCGDLVFEERVIRVTSPKELGSRIENALFE